MTEVEALSLLLFFCLKIKVTIWIKEVICIAVQLITNNPLVYQKYSEKMDSTFLDGQYMDVLKAVRDKVHNNFSIITHPLMGSIKPNETPYRSLIIEKADKFDLQSLSIIESSIQSCDKFLRDKPVPEWSQKILIDFQVVDKHLFESALESINI